MPSWPGSLPSHLSKHPTHHPRLIESRHLLQVSQFVLHDEGFGDEFIDLVLIAELVVEVHNLLLAVIFVYRFQGIYLADVGEITHADVSDVLGSDPPVLVLYLVLDVAAELGVLACFVCVKELV